MTPRVIFGFVLKHLTVDLSCSSSNRYQEHAKRVKMPSIFRKEISLSELGRSNLLGSCPCRSCMILSVVQNVEERSDKDIEVLIILGTLPCGKITQNILDFEGQYLQLPCKLGLPVVRRISFPSRLVLCFISLL
jgi:hypothetical protein